MNTRKRWAEIVRERLLKTARTSAKSLALAGLVALAVTATSNPAIGQVPAAGAAAASPEVHEVAVAVGRSLVIPAPWPVTRVSVTDPKIADVQVFTPTQVMISGKTAGTTDIFLWNKDETLWQARVEVQIDRTAIKNELTRLFPSSKIDLRQVNDALVLSGTLSRAEEAEQLHRFLDTLAVKYVDATNVAGVQQVQLKVIIAEANRTAIRTLGINAFVAGSSLFGGSTIGPDGGGPVNPVSIGTPGGTKVGSNAAQFLGPTDVGSAVTLFGGVPGADLQFFVSALNENQYLRVLAEPSLVALSGQEANFLAGGEFPIPVVQGGGGGTNNASITIEYKEFGVRLKFKPTVLGDGTIRLQVAPEVSELSTGPGAITISGFTVPALVTRRAETTLELGSGQTFGMAGLINQSVESRTTRIPGLGDVPVLGALFRSVRYQKGDTELLVLVTASLVEPLSVRNDPLVPGVLHVQPTDWELYALGNIEGRVPAKIAPVDATYLKQSGLTRLRGPGAWITYESKAPVSDAAMKSDDKP